MAKWGGSDTTGGSKPATAGSKWGGEAKPKKEKKKQGAGSPLDILGAPQQIVSHLIKGARTLDPGEVVEAGKSAAKLALPGLGSALFEEQKPLSFTETVGAKKLPFGGETLGQIATDPLTYGTLGVGPIAKSGLKSLRSVLGEGAEQAVRKGGSKVLSPAERAAVRSHIFETAAKDVGEKKAAKIADTQMRALKSRARGGVGLHVPGTPIDVHLGGGFEEGLLGSAVRGSPMASKLGSLFTGTDVVAQREAAEQAAASLRSKTFAPGSAPYEQARLFDVAAVPTRPVPGERLFDVDEFGVPKPKDVGQGSLLGEAARQAPTGPTATQGRLFTPPKGGGIMDALPEPTPEQTQRFAKVNKKIDELAQAPRGTPGTISKAWRRMAVTYPGTVVNRLRQAAFYGAAAGQRPDQWARNMARGQKNFTAAEKLLKQMGLQADEALENPEFVERLTTAIGPKAAKEELAFRRFGEAQTYFKDIDQAAPKTRRGELIEKARLIKKGGEKVRAAGTQVEESSRRANFLFAAEHKFGTFEEAGAYVKHILPGVSAMSEAERIIAKPLPFWTAMRADWQSVIRLMAESPGRVSALTRLGGGLGGPVGLPGGGTVELGQLKERHMPPLELAKMLNIPYSVAQGELYPALQAFSEMTGGPEVALIEQANEVWRRKNQDVPPQEQWYRFMRAFNPYLQRLPSATEKVLSGREENLTKADKSAMEAFIRFVSGIEAKTGPEEKTVEEIPGARKKTEPKKTSKWG